MAKTSYNASTGEVIFEYDDSIDFFIGLIFLFLTVFGIFENFCVFGAFVKYRKELNSRTNTFLTSLALCDLLMATFGAPMVALSALNKEWMFGHAGCVYYGFETYVTGLTVIGHLVIIAIDRKMAITSPIRYNALANNRYITAGGIGLAWFHGTFWAALPLFGLQEYTYEGRGSCSLNWLSKKPVDMTFGVLMFLSSYLVPIVVMSYCYGHIFITVRSSRKRFGGDGDDEASRKKKANEKKLAFNLAMTMVFYMLVWTPYAFVVLWAIIGDASVIPEAAMYLPGMFAKFSMVVNPILYVGLNKSHRGRIRRFLGLPVAVEPQ